MGDKKSSFLGSREWIGSQEVGLVLNELLGIEGKYLVLEKGGEIKKYFRRLRDHFASQGTPVMIGGGVLAFTCLGVMWNEQMNECKLLILDPHYVGRDTLDEVIKKKQRMEGYSSYCCGWRPVKEIFEDRYHYNLFLPSRPVMV